ncbi:anhydro-N-acetylmuramic acid kinase [Salisaeta longa]|uniref:anhydro-N-acetylmuramic acid kinase n=1 Tax=Salisaeta longa TaxID=503170 RepID=UPI0003B4909B|nr:anhydro-N-acetylmuramic acid kinase [Salisaeta longa]
MTAPPPERLVVGVMSGTSLDGIDAALARIAGTGRALTVEPLAFAHTPYPIDLQQRIREQSAPETSAVPALARLNVRLARGYAEAVDALLANASVPRSAVDVVGCHGQTVQHVPDAAPCAGVPTRATLQLGDGPTLATLLDCPVLTNFRTADMARGGQGAPLVPYFDYARFQSEDQTRLLLNLGGIANLTLLPADGALGDVRAFDTGPANMVIDALADCLFDAPYDPDGQHAAAGTPNHDVLADWLSHPYFAEPPPKSTGRETFGASFVERVRADQERHGLSDADTLATATLLTAASVYQAYARFLRTEHAADALIVSGGGVHNSTLLQMLRDAFSPIPVHTTAHYGINPDAKEALCFAVLAHEWCNGVATNVPAVTGAEGPALLGSLSRPPSAITAPCDCL